LIEKGEKKEEEEGIEIVRTTAFPHHGSLQSFTTCTTQKQEFTTFIIFACVCVCVIYMMAFFSPVTLQFWQTATVTPLSLSLLPCYE